MTVIWAQGGAEDVPISGELVYTPAASDVGRVLLCSVLPDGTPASALKARVGPVESAADQDGLSGIVKPLSSGALAQPSGKGCQLAGSAVAGNVLTASVTYVCSVPEGVSLWQWFTVDGQGNEELVPAARSNRLLLTDEDIGKRIRCATLITVTVIHEYKHTKTSHGNNAFMQCTLCPAPCPHCH